MRKNFWLWAVLAAGVGFWLYRRSQATRAMPLPVPKAPLPSGARFTGKTQMTSNGAPPNYPQEVVGYAIKQWAEVALADGRRDWVEMKGS